MRTDRYVIFYFGSCVAVEVSRQIQVGGDVPRVAKHLCTARLPFALSYATKDQYKDTCIFKFVLVSKLREVRLKSEEENEREAFPCLPVLLFELDLLTW